MHTPSLNGHTLFSTMWIVAYSIPGNNGPTINWLKNSARCLQLKASQPWLDNQYGWPTPMSWKTNTMLQWWLCSTPKTMLTDIGGLMVFGEFTKTGHYVNKCPLKQCKTCWSYDHYQQTCTQENPTCRLCSRQHHEHSHKCKLYDKCDCQHLLLKCNNWGEAHPSNYLQCNARQIVVGSEWTTPYETAGGRKITQKTQTMENNDMELWWQHFFDSSKALGAIKGNNTLTQHMWQFGAFKSIKITILYTLSPSFFLPLSAHIPNITLPYNLLHVHLIYISDSLHRHPLWNHILTCIL